LACLRVSGRGSGSLKGNVISSLYHARLLKSLGEFGSVTHGFEGLYGVEHTTIQLGCCLPSLGILACLMLEWGVSGDILTYLGLLE